MGAIFTNNASSTLAAGISAAATSLTVQTGHGERFPSLATGEWFPVTIVKSATELEIVRCIARSGDTLTIVRAQEGTSALSFNSGDLVEHRLTAEVLNGLISDVESIGVPEPLPSLYRFDAVDGLPLPDGMTFARASGGYALNRQGRLQWYGVNAPRHAYKPDGSYRGILVEGAATNLFTRSQELDHSDWSKSATTVSTNTEVAPDGTTTAEKITPTAVNSGHGVSRSMPYTAGVPVCISAYVKSAGYTGVVIHAPNTAFDAGSSPRAWFNLATGEMSGTGGFAGEAGMERLADGWVRVWAIFTPTVTISGTTVFYVMPTGSETTSTGYEASGSDGILLWGAQFEEASHPTSYVPTAGTTVARSADNWGAPIAALNGWSDNPYSMYVEADADASYARNALLTVRPSSTIRGASLQMQQVGSDVDVGLRHRGGGSAVTLFTRSPFTRGRRIITAGSFDGAALQSATGGVDAGGAAVADGNTFVALELKVGRDGATGAVDGEYLYGCIKSFALWDRALSAAQLAEITGRGLADKATIDSLGLRPMVNRERYKYTALLDGTASENNATLAAVVARANAEYGPGAELHVTSGLVTSLPNFAGLRALVGTRDTVLDASGVSNPTGTIATASGSLGSTIYPLAQDAAAGGWAIYVTNAQAALMDLTPGKWLLLRHDLPEVENSGAKHTLAPTGEWVQIARSPSVNPITPGGSTTRIWLNRPLKHAYLVEHNAGLKIPALIPPFAYERIQLLGPGQTHLPANPSNSDGNTGLSIQFSEDAQFLDSKVFFAERGAFRNHMNVNMYSEACQAEFSRPRGAQIQYGFVNNGTGRKYHIRNFNSQLGRHGIDFSATEGFIEEAIEEYCTIVGTYSAAYAEHDGVIVRRSKACVVDACGSGWDYRGGGRGFGQRINFEPTVKSTQANPAENGTNLGAPNAAFNLRDFAGNIEVINMDVRDTLYVLRAEHYDAGSGPAFNYRNHAPEHIKFTGGKAERIRQGFRVYHEGSIQDTVGDSDYNLKKTGPYTFEGVQMLMTPRTGEASSLRPFLMYGLINRVAIIDCDVTFPGTAAAVADIRGVDEFIMSGGRIDGSSGVIVASVQVHDGTGSKVSKSTGLADLSTPPTVVNGTELISSLTADRIIMPRSKQASSSFPAKTGTTSEVLIGSLRVDGYIGKQAHIRIRGVYHHTGSADVGYRVAVNGANVYSLGSSPNGAISLERNIQCAGSDTAKRQFNGNWNTAGSAGNLQTLSINTSQGVLVEFFATMTDAGDSVKLDVGVVEVFPNG